MHPPLPPLLNLNPNRNLTPRSLSAITLLLLSASLLAATPHTTKPPAKPAPAPTPTPGKNPLLPIQIPLESLYPDLSLSQKSPDTAPAGLEPLYTPEDYLSYRQKFAADADSLAKKKSSALIDFSNKLIAAANEPNTTPGEQRLLLLRAAIDCYRTRAGGGGFETANKAIQQYLKIMDLHSPTQVAALWTLANAMSRTVTTPKPSRIHYSAIAARANMQLTILLLDADQLDAAQSLQKQIGYHEGWLHTSGASPADKIAYTQIPKVRALVKQTQTTMDYLATQYQPAINGGGGGGDDNALMAIYLYGRYVKQKPEIVADLPARKPNSPLASLAAALDAVDRKSDPEAPYTAAETLKTVAGNLPDGVLKQRTLYAALQNYRLFIADPRTERDRVKRTLARMATEAVIADGAHGPSPVVNPFAPPTPATTQPSTTHPAILETSPDLAPPSNEEIHSTPSPTTMPERTPMPPTTHPVTTVNTATTNTTTLPSSTPTMPPFDH